MTAGFRINDDTSPFLKTQDKGQKMMVESFIKTVKDGGQVPIPLAEILAVNRTTFKVLDSLRSRKALSV